MKTYKILCFALYGEQAASNRVRLGQYKEELYSSGFELKINSLLINEYIIALSNKASIPFLKLILSFFERIKLLLFSQKYDLLIIHCELFPFLPGWLEQLFLRKPYIYDFDDAFYLKYNSGKYKLLKPFLGSKFKRIIKNASFITAGNRNLANFAKKYNPNVIILPSVVDTNIFYKKNRKANSCFTLGWIGSSSTAIYLEKLVKPLALLGKQIPLKLIVVGAQGPSIQNVIVESIPWSLENEVDLINQFDVGLMPLNDDEWSRGKCAYKLIQCMACEVCVIASPVGSNIDVVIDSTGFLAESDQDWYDTLLKLSQDISLRDRLGKASANRIMQNYSLQTNKPLLINAINKAMSINKK
jgi:glycosyltransferase involved in cell wall biosynthesis